MDKKELFIFQFCHNDVLRFWLCQISTYFCTFFWRVVMFYLVFFHYDGHVNSILSFFSLNL